MMNDFLHSLRNTMDKRNDKNRRNYNGNQFNPADRRRPKDPRYGHNRQTPDHSQLTQLLGEWLPEIKKNLERLTESQDRLIDARVQRAAAEARKADALEQIALSLAKLVDLQQADPRTYPTLAHFLPPALLSHAPQAASASGADRENVLAAIRSLRENGLSFSAIAAHLTENDIPTFSGKGRWCGQTVLKLIKQPSS
jgi:DNA-binding transcriptional MerR regulator